MQLEYNALIADLKCGHEFEFNWEDETLTICCNYPTKWFFCIPEKGITFEAESIEKLLEHIRFNGQTFRDIVPKIKESTLF